MQGNVNIPDSTITTNLSFRQLVLMNMQQLTNFPYIEKDFDALTDYELLCLVVKFLNDVIANQNEQNASITRMYESFLALQTYVNNTKDTLEDAFNELDDYVRNYFDNLDVQEEINNKLDQMLEDGVLEQIIEQFLQSTAIWCFDTVDDMKQATNLTNGSYTKTLGFYNMNDGGEGTYKVRTKTVDDVVDNASIIQLYDNTLIAELIFKDYISAKQFGAYGDNIHDDTLTLQNAINYCLSKNGILKINNGIYKITDTLNINKTIKIYGEFNQGKTNDDLIYGAEIHQTGTNKSIFNINGNNYGSIFENMRLSGDGSDYLNGTTIGISQSQNSYFSEFIIKNIHFSYFLQNGIVLDDTSIGTIDSCDFGENTVALLINKGSRINISNCNFWNNNVAIKIKNATDLSILNNWIESVHNDSIGLLLQAPSRILFSSLLNNTFNMINTSIKFDGITNITEYMCFDMINIKNNRFTGSSPFIIDMKNSDNVQNTNPDNRWNITLENCVFNNVTSNQAIDIDFDYLGLGGWKMINCRAYSGWYAGHVNMFTSGQSNTATQLVTESGLNTNGALNFDTIVSFPIIKNNSIFKGTYKLMVKDENGNGNVLLSGKNGTTANRPSNPLTGEIYFDTTLGKPIWWNSYAWVNANGENV